MQRFQFKLQRLLDYRKIREEQAQAEFVKATRVFLHEQDILQQLKEVLTETMAELEAEQQQSSSLIMLKMFQDYIDTTREGIRLQTAKVVAAAQRRQAALAAFEEAARRRKAVDSLRERRLQQYQDEVMREEQGFLDEIASQHFTRDS